MRRELGRRGREHVASHLTAEREVSLTMDVYDRVLAQS